MGRRQVGNKKDLVYFVGVPQRPEILTTEFEFALKRSVEDRTRRGFIKTYKPVIDDLPYRIFHSMGDYHRWCETKLPRWLGYGKAK